MILLTQTAYGFFEVPFNAIQSGCSMVSKKEGFKKAVAAAHHTRKSFQWAFMPWSAPMRVKGKDLEAIELELPVT